jgi:hypothetical protein
VKGRHAAQLVVECYQHTGETLDLAAWDLSSDRRPVRDRLEDLAWVIAEMGLDLWYFQGLNLDDARHLTDHLETHFRLDFRIVSDVRGPGTLLVSRTSGLNVEPIEPPLSRPRRKGSKSGSDRARTSAASPDGLHLRVSPLGRRPIDLWLRPSADRQADPACYPEPIEADTLVVNLGRSLAAADLRAWRAAGRPVLAAASSQSASILILPGKPSSIDSLFLTANAVPLLVPSSESLTIVRDRGFPETTRLVSAFDPLAVRLLLGEPRPVQGSAINPMSILDADLERALTDLLSPLVARLANELRLPSR